MFQFGTVLAKILIWMLLAVLGPSGYGMLPNPAFAQPPPTVPKNPPPDWVKIHEPAQTGVVPYEEIQDGEYFLQVDKQIKVSNTSPTQTYRHFRIYVANETGLEQTSPINISFDPSYQTLALNQLQIIRDGKILSKLDNAEIQLLRREKGLESLMYDGRYTASIIIDDVRVGDVLEYAYTLTGENPIFGGIFSSWLSVSWRVPVGKLDFILHWPKGRPFYQTNHKTDFVLKKQEKADEILYTLSKEALASYRSNSETPDWHRPYGDIQMSQIREWSEVVDWALPLYRVAYQKDPFIEALAQSLDRNNATDDQRIMSVLSYIQKEIRYLGIEIGVNSHRPSPPRETLKRRYGDCKDKAVAMVALLEALGINAQPVLVNTDVIRYKADFHPAIDAFNHVIVRVALPPKVYWLDPTRSFQGNNVDLAFQPDYGFALIIMPGITDLTPMPSNREMVGLKVKERFILPSDYESPANYTITSTFSGLDAENLRRRVAEDGAREIQSSYLDYYRKYYPGIKIDTPIEIRDDEARNEMMTIERYQIDGVWEKDDESKEWNANFHANLVDSYLRKPKQRKRKDPFWISYPERVEQRIDIQLPESWHIDPFEFKEENAYFRLLAKADYEAPAKFLHLTYQYNSLQDAVAPESINEYLEAIDRSKDHLNYYLSKPLSTGTATKTTGILDWWHDHLNVFLIGLAGAAFVFVLVEWIIDLRKPVLLNPVAYYPVSLHKFAILNIITLGLYQLYWFYKQWVYIRCRDDSAIMPVFRTLFLPFWFYSLFKDLRADSMMRFGRSNLPAAPWIGLLLITFIAADLADAMGKLGELGSLLNFFCLLPFVNYINYVNRHDDAAMIANSRFRPRHFILSGIVGLVLLYFLATNLYWLPAGEVIQGNQVPQRSIRFMQRQGLLQDKADLIYFYSDALWSDRDDGNGVTKNLLFSYWRDKDTGKLIVRTAKYADIDHIRISGGKSDEDTAVITVTTKSGAEFLLYAATEKGMHKKMIHEIKTRLAEVHERQKDPDSGSSP